MKFHKGIFSKKNSRIAKRRGFKKMGAKLPSGKKFYFWGRK